MAIGSAIAAGASMIGGAVSALGGASTVVPAVAGIGGSIVSGRQRSSAIRNAAQAQAQATDQASQVLRQNFLDTVGLMRPRIAAGDAAIGQMMFELGLSDSPEIPQAALAQAGPQQPDYAGYVDQHQDLAAAYGGLSQSDQQYLVGQGYDMNGDGRIGRDEYGAFHYTTYGQGEGRQLPNVMTNQPATSTGGATGEEAGDPYARFRNTPGYQFAMEEGLRAVEGSAAARSGLLRGSTLQRLQQTGQGIADQTYNQYFNRLAGLAGMGGQATGAVAGAGQSTAGNLANVFMQGGQQQANAAVAQGANQASMYGDIFGAAGDLFGGINWGGGNSGGQPSSYHTFPTG